MSLYKKYRPTMLEEVVGNSSVVESLDNMLSELSECPHAFLLSGGTGCGKTTVGRIMADRLGSSGGDFREIDSADFRGIDTVRKIIQQSQYRAMESDAIVWLMDECHQLSKDAQSAILKILEDTPKHVYFILCTTEPQKLLPTIRNRCTQYEMKPLTDVQMKGLLRKVVKAEGENLSKPVYEQIIQDSLGHPRSALQILDVVLRLDPEEQLEAAARAADNTSASIDLCRLLIKGGGWKRVAEVLSGLKEEQPESIRRHILGYCQSILLKGDNERAGLVMEEMIEPFYNTGFPGLVFACYSVMKG
jgi:DNA polymerase-3 subunit gamma/tau